MFDISSPIPNSYLNLNGTKYPIIGGRGILIQKYHYISLTIYLTPPDGGPSSYCRLRGTTGELGYNNYLKLKDFVCFLACRVPLYPGYLQFCYWSFSQGGLIFTTLP
ncbi:MAG: hypothetical protein L6N96_03590 [Candidatus Methylarchaceae archaeon HK02M2]|nr:hypothetical protein [Candidatus Methylarchaceae archaeon HK02M2]